MEEKHIFTEQQTEFLRAHTLAVLATGRPDGSPQVSTVMYEFDGHDIVVSIKSYTAKWKNAVRQPKVALCINEGRKQMILYGTAECIADDPQRTELTRRVFTRISGAPAPSAQELAPTLDQQQRTILRIVPVRVFMGV